MAAKNVFVSAELDWAEERLEEWKKYIDNNPVSELKDREGTRATAKGGQMPYTIASIEAQGKFLQETMKNYLSLLKEVNHMREAVEQKKINARGVESLSPGEDGTI